MLFIYLHIYLLIYLLQERMKLLSCLLLFICSFVCLFVYSFIHLSGRAIWTKHIRDGVELPEIARDDHYDFNFQVTSKIIIIN